MSIIDYNCNLILQKIDFSQLVNKKILITGATGLIGIHLARSILKLNQNNSLVCICRNKPQPYLFDLINNINTTIIDEDINYLFEDYEFVTKYLHQFDYIIHAAGYGQPIKFADRKLQTIALNTEVTKKLFSLLKLDGTFLFCSTSEIYSGLDKEEITENNVGVTLPSNPRACYIESKKCGETICNIMKQDFSVNTKIARISYTYGPGSGVDDTRALNSFILRCMREPQNSPLILMDSGSSIRTFGYISDVCSMLFNILLHSKDITYNVSGNSKISIKDLAQKISNHFDKSIQISTDETTLLGNPKIINISTEKYDSEFGKTEYLGLDNGLKNTIEWYKEII